MSREGKAFLLASLAAAVLLMVVPSHANVDSDSSAVLGHGALKQQPTQPPEITKEELLLREQFRTLLIANPNYFGNLAKSPYKPVTQIVGSTRFEELMCVGFNPQFDLLEGVVHIKQTTGYLGEVCHGGSLEYVRFYVDWGGTGVWTDQGVTAFRAYDIPGEKPLEYDVTLPINPDKDFCFKVKIARVRAILSWNLMPPPNQPGWTPVWGNVMEANIQIGARPFLLVRDLIEIAKVQLPSEVLSWLDLNQYLVPLPPQPQPLAELYALYKGKDIPNHRLLTTEVQKVVESPSLEKILELPDVKVIWPGLEIDIAQLVTSLLATQFNTSYEQLTCVGLNPSRDTLVATLSIKRPYGYLGDTCHRGSYEYVAFWVDWGDGAGWTYAGTTSVNVHDVPSIPRDGLQFAAFVPFRTRHPAHEAPPKIVKVRAILSWQVPPPPVNPNYVPKWGNWVETLVHIRPEAPVDPATHPPFMETVGSMAVSSIDSTTGLANGPAALAGFTAHDSPFGGEIVITGHVAYPPDVVGGGATPLKYRVMVRPGTSGPWQPLTNQFWIWLSQLLDGVWTGPTPYLQSTPDGWYDYMEDLTDGPGNAMRFVAGNVLARWQTGPLMSGLWQIRMDVKDPVSGTVWAGTQVVTVRLDNQGPFASININPGPAGTPGACGVFTVGSTLTGTYSASDQHFGSLALTVEPAGGVMSPASRSYPTVPTGGESGTWTLNTDGMTPCGYVVRIHVWDRTIVNSGYVGFYASDVKGFSLTAK